MEALPARSWPRTLKRTVEQFIDDNLLQWAAALTFFATIALFPAMLALVAVLGVVGAPAVQPLVENVSQLAPGTARDIALEALRGIERSERAGLAFAVSLGVALWSASGYVGAFIPAANVVWEVEEGRSLVKRLVLRIVLTVVLLLLIAVAAAAVVVTGPIAERLGDLLGAGDAAVSAWSIARWPFQAAVVMLLLSILYWASPNVRHPGWRWITPGSVLAVVLWILASLGFSLYVGTVESLNATYGSIGGVLVFLLWLWLTNIAILLGAELNAEIEREAAIRAGMPAAEQPPFLPMREAPEAQADR